MTKFTSTLISVSALVLASLAVAETTEQANALGRQEAGQTAQTTQQETQAEQRAEAKELVDEARLVAGELRTDPEVAKLLDSAHGIFIVPDYAKAAAVIGGRGGEGVVMLRQEGEWSAPAFYDFGGATLGINVGAEAGSIAMLLMTEKAAAMFRDQEDNWTLDASAGVTIVNYSTATEATLGETDVVFWSDTAGAYAGADIGINNINSDEEENEAFYGEKVSSQQILTGSVSNDEANELREELSS